MKNNALIKRLKPDGSYGSHIDGYGDDHMAQKLQFLRDALALLKQTGQFLAANGLSQCDVHKNESGMAGSGEVYGEYWKPEDPSRRVHVCVESSCVDRAREDGVILYARTQPYKLEATRGKTGKQEWRRAGQSGPNQWLSAAFNAQELADRILMIYDPATSPAMVSAHTLSTGTQAFPPLYITDESQAPAWFEAHRDINAALWTDARNPADEPDGSKETEPAQQLSMFEQLSAAPADEVLAGQ
jgi:hypothetical protein